MGAGTIAITGFRRRLLGDRASTLRPTSASILVMAVYFWWVLRNTLGWILILISFVAGPLVPGPGGIPLFLIGFALITFPGKRRLTARVLRGRPIRPAGNGFTLIAAGVSLLIAAFMILLVRDWSGWPAHAFAHGPVLVLILWLNVALQWRPDVVLLDIGLPGLDGYEVARRLRSELEMQDVRLIALTGYGRDTDIALAREAGFDAHLVKPCDFDELEKLMAATPTSSSKTR